MYLFKYNFNTWDTNYHVFDLESEIEYLIDTFDAIRI